MIRPRVLTDNENQIRMIEILEMDSPFSYANGLCQSLTTRFVTHIRAIGQVVCSQCSHQCLVKECCLIRRSARGVVNATFWGRHRLNCGSYMSQSIVPIDWSIMRRIGLQNHRLSYSTLTVQPIIRFFQEFGHGVFLEKGRIDVRFHCFIRNRLGTIFAKFE